MHGRLKVYTTEEQKLIKQKEQQKQLAAYRQGFKRILESRKPDGYDNESLQICSKILTRQPDVYTLWNYRKEATLLQIEKAAARNKLENCAKGDDDDDSDDPLVIFLQNELQLTQQCLMTNQKSYSSWHHRFWILERHPDPNWQSEFFLCGQYLSIDERNFHCWDFRRLLLNKKGIPLVNEITFSTDRINVNFSNYSSWHYRSTLKFLDASTLSDELMLIQSAIYTDPYDSSAWFYLKWVLNDPNLTPELRDEVLNALNQLAELELDCRWILIAKCWLLTDEEEKEDCYNKLAKIDVLRRGRYVKN